MLTQATRCTSCKKPLASDNRVGLCSPCARRRTKTASAPPAAPAHLWTSDPVKRAVERQDFGALLRLYRESFDPPITQSTLGTWLGLSQAQVSRIEGARTIITDLGKLTRWSLTLGLPSHALWFAIPAARGSTRVESTPEVLHSVELEPGHEKLRNGRTVPGGIAQIVCQDDVDVVLEMTRSFRQIDNRYGAGSIRSAVGMYLGSEVRPMMIEGRFSRGTRRPFQLASVELHQLAGWIAYDVGDHQSGKQHLRDALSIASDASDDALIAEMLAAMSHQAAFLRRSEETIDLALAARRSAIRSGAPALHAESLALEAQGLALRRDGRRCISALHRAERSFLAATAENTPQWLRYFDNAYLSAKFAQALRDLGHPKDAERFARASLQMSEGYERGKLFNTALLATILIDGRQVDEAVTTARSAVEMARKVRSARAHGYLRDVADRMALFESHSAEVRSVRKEIAALRVRAE